MNIEFFIAKRLSIGKEAKRFVSRSIVRFAYISIALGLAVMIISVAVVTGFKKSIQHKVFGFGSHIQMVNFDDNTSYESVPISRHQDVLKNIRLIPDVQHIQVYATKAGIIKTQTENQGVVLKGVDSTFDWNFFKENLITGELLNTNDSVPSNKVLISKYLSSLLQLKPGDKFVMYFIQDPPRMRPFQVSGIYETGLEDFDKLFIFCDIRHIQRLNDWKPDQISGFEISVSSFKNILKVHQQISDMVSLKLKPDGSGLKVVDIKEKYQQIFDWLNLQDTNVWIILALMLLVAGFNMISALLILILERTRMIGLLKALGANNQTVMRIFLYQSFILILKGLIWGNIIGVSLCYLQYHFHFIPLDQSSYFVNSVPINFNLFYIFLLNIGTTILTLIMLMLPSLIISKISPESTLRYS